jgi:hypothetical protein
MEERRPWLRQRRAGPGIDREFFAYWMLTGLFVGFGVLVLANLLLSYLPSPGNFFSDARLYYAATQAWVSGGDPWAVTSPNGVTFAGWPPTLLLCLPLLPFGPDAAGVFWGAADLVGWLVVMRRLRLGPWWILFAPFLEGLFPGNPDPALAALALVAASWIAALTKPYSIPSILAEGRARSIAFAAGTAVVSLLFLPWSLFVSEFSSIQAALAAQAGHVTAWGDPRLMALVVVALLVLGGRTALRLVVPTLWPSGQLHYSVFSTRAGAESAALAVALSVPGYTAQLVVVYAGLVAVRRVARDRRRRHGSQEDEGARSLPASGRTG